MKAIILSIGDELVLGQTVDTNSAWLSARLAEVGCPVAAHITLPDDQGAIEQAIGSAFFQCEFLIISGGIGPTEDDLTRQALAAVVGQPLELNQQWLEHLREFFRQRGRDMPESNRIQAMIPRGARMIFNTAGTAAGIHVRSEISDLRCDIFVLPGVPKEMKIMFERDVLPAIRQRSDGGVILSRMLHTFGLGESAVAEKLGELMRRGRNPSVGTTVANGIVSIRINARFGLRRQAEQELERTAAACRAALGELIFGEDDQTLAEAVVELLIGKGRTVATAESCTGGLLAKMLTDVPGSSACFGRGWVTYADRAKIEELGVPADLIARRGAVSETVAADLARNARERAQADFGLAISGVAGPSGGTPEKPVGTVHIALADGQSLLHRKLHFPGDREMIRDRSARMALAMLRYYFLDKELPF